LGELHTIRIPTAILDADGDADSDSEQAQFSRLLSSFDRCGNKALTRLFCRPSPNIANLNNPKIYCFVLME